MSEFKNTQLTPDEVATIQMMVGGGQLCRVSFDPFKPGTPVTIGLHFYIDPSSECGVYGELNKILEARIAEVAK